MAVSRRLVTSLHAPISFPSSPFGSLVLRAFASSIGVPADANLGQGVDAGPLSGHKSYASTRFGIAFDIDGVIIQGGRKIPGVEAAMSQLYYPAATKDEWSLAARLPRVAHIFFTNGGGMTEADRARRLSGKLGVPVTSSQVQLGHSPFADLAHLYKDKWVLCVGKGDPVRAMYNYGFRHAVNSEDINHRLPLIWPPWSHAGTHTPAGHEPLPPPIAVSGSAGPHLHPAGAGGKSNYDLEPIAAVFVCSDPLDWGRDLQIICDVVRARGYMENLLETKGGWEAPRGREDEGQLPVYIAAGDLQFPTEFALPRFGMGSFTQALTAVYKSVTGGRELKVNMFGKPTRVAFASAARKLKLQAVACASGVRGDALAGAAADIDAHVALDRLYMVGDNPLTDIKGAREAGRPWVSIMTRTGCFQDADNHDVYPADLVVPSVVEAIQAILEREKVPLNP